ncbi:unnamed protein product [Urochloa humidicola]
MARFSGSVLVLLALLGSLAGAAAAAFTDGGGCEVSALAADVAASCAAGAATPPCCEPVLASVELGGGACLCRLASETPVLHAGLNGSALTALYAGCSGGGIVAAASFAACQGGAPPSSSTVLALPSAAAAAHLAGVAKDRVGGAPETPSATSGLGGPVSQHRDVIRVIRHLASDDKAAILSVTVTNVIGLCVWVIIAAVQVYSCIYGRKA